MSEKVLKLGIPKGSLQKATFDLFERAGFNVTGFDRSYFPRIDDPEIQLIMLRAQEMSRYVEDGVLDAGFTGYDWIRENNSDVHEVCELQYSKATSNPTRWVLAVPNESGIEKPEELEGGIIATELVDATRRYFEEKGINVKVEFSWGATEVKARLVNGIVELTETGSSIKANNLKIIDTLMTSTTRFIANNDAWADGFKKQKIESIAMLLNAAIDAKTLVGLKMNVLKDSLDAILKLLPAEKSPTVAPLADEQYVAIEIIISEKDGRELIPALKRAGASGIFTYSLNNVIHSDNREFKGQLNMAGHSHWAGIKHKKAANDAKRGKVWSKIARMIIVAAKAGGGDPGQNLTLRYAIDKGKAANMPKDTIEKAIKKGTGELGAIEYVDVLYEGYAPGGVAIMVEGLTDNRNRTAPEIKKIFEKRGGSMGASGCVSYMFKKKGVIIVKADAADEETLMEIALNAGADDFENIGEVYEITCEPESYDALKVALEEKEIPLESSELSRIPDSTISVADSETARKLLNLVEDFEDHDDVQEVFGNFDIPDDILSQIE